MQHMVLAGRYHDKHPGAACKLKPEQLADLKEDLIAGPTKCGFESGMWTVPMISTRPRQVRHRIQQWKTCYTACSGERRAQNTESASKEEREKFKKNHGAGCRIRTQGIHHSTGRVLHHRDGAAGDGFQLAWRSPYRLHCPASGSILGVLSSDRQFHAFYDKANSDNSGLSAGYTNSLASVWCSWTTPAITSQRPYWRAWRSSTATLSWNTFQYTPELNPVEPQWREQKRHTAGRPYQSAEDMQKSIDTMYETGEIKTVKTYDYLTVPA